MYNFDPNEEAVFRFKEEDLELFNYLKARDIKRLYGKHSEAELSIMAIIQAYRSKNKLLEKERVILELGTKYLWIWGLLVVLAGVLSGYYMPNSWVSKPIYGALFFASLTNLFFIGGFVSKFLSSKIEGGGEIEEGEEGRGQELAKLAKKLIEEEEEMVLEFVQPANFKNGHWLYLNDIANLMPNNMEPRKLSGLLKNMGFLSKRANDGTKFLVKLAKNEDKEKSEDGEGEDKKGIFTTFTPKDQEGQEEDPKTALETPKTAKSEDK